MASISTPVLPVFLTVEVILIAWWASSISNSTFISPRRRGWQRGIRLGVCLAAMMPAIWATVRTSPLGIFPFDKFQGFRLHVDSAFGDGFTLGVRFGSDIHHAGSAGFVDMTEFVHPLSAYLAEGTVVRALAFNQVMPHGLGCDRQLNQLFKFFL